MALDHTDRHNELPYSPPAHLDPSSIVLLTNPSNQLHNLELTLRGLSEDSTGATRIICDPLLNEEGINRILGIVKSVVSQVTILSNLDKNGISVIMDLLSDTLAKDLMINRLKYQIESPTARDVIFFESLSNAFICLRRSYEGDDKRFWKGSVMEYVQKFDGTGDNKRSLFGKVLGGNI